MSGFDLSTISGVYVGSTQYSLIYYGSNLIWPTSTLPSVSDYVLSGLVFQLDGIDKGTGAEWTDLKAGMQLTKVGSSCYSTLDGYYFDKDFNSYLECTGINNHQLVQEFENNSNLTVEVCFKEIDSDIKYFLFGFRGGNSSKQPLFYRNGSLITWSQGAVTYNGSSIVSGSGNTVSLNADRSVINGTVSTTLNSTDYWDSDSLHVLRIGQAYRGGAAQNPFKGYVYSIRIYNRKLTQAELLLNLEIDNVRFNLGLSI